MKTVILFILFCISPSAFAGVTTSAVRTYTAVSAGSGTGTGAIIRSAESYGIVTPHGSGTVVAANDFYAPVSVVGAMAEVALSVGAVGAALFSSPITGAALAVAGVGMAGYDLYQALKSQGVNIATSGAASQSKPTAACRSGTPAGYTCFLADASKPFYGCQGYSSIYTVNGVDYCQVPTSSLPYFSDYASTSMTNQQFKTAIATAIQDNNIARDAAAFALSRSVDPALYIPSSTSSSSQPTTWTSPEVQTGSTTNPATTTKTKTQVTIQPATSIVAEPLVQEFTITTVYDAAGQQISTNTQTSSPYAPADPAPQPTKTTCTENPSAAMCQAFDNGGLPNEAISTRSIDVSAGAFISTLFTNTAACPAPRVLSLSHGSYSFSYQPACDFMSSFRYAALAVGAFISAMIIFGHRTEGG